jgi:uncharacterized protein YggE
MNNRWIATAVGGAAIGIMAVGVALVAGNHQNQPGNTAAAVAPTSTQAPQNTSTSGTPNRTITVSGEGKVTAKPDQANLSLGVQAQASTATKALADANVAANHLIAALKATGIANDDIVTSGLQVYPTYTGNQVITGYQASSQVTVTVRDITKAGPVIDAAAAAAGDHITVGGVSFTISDPEKIIGAARSAAIDNAKARAGQYASAAGAGVGQVLQISEVSISPMPIYTAAPSAGSAAKDAYTPIQTGTQDLSVSVTVVYALT